MVRKFFPLTFNASVSRFQTNVFKIRKTVVTRVDIPTSDCYLFSKYVIEVLLLLSYKTTLKSSKCNKNEN